MKIKHFKKWNPQMHVNKKAFDEVIQNYISSKYKSTTVLCNKKEGGKSTPNPAAPSALDFVCDVDKILKEKLKDSKFRRQFRKAYIYVGDPFKVFEKSVIAYIEQIIGSAFRKKGLFPTKGYFNPKRK